MIKTIFQSALIKTASLYTAINFINASIPILLLPVLTRFLSPHDYGLVAIFQVLLGVITVLIGLNTDVAIRRKYYQKDTIDFPVYVTNCVFIQIICLVFCTLVLSLAKDHIERLSGFPSNWIWSVVIASFALSNTKLVLSLWQVQVKPAAYGKFRILLMLANIGISCWLIISLEMDWRGRVLGQVLSLAIFSAISFYLLSQGKWIKWQFNYKYIRHIVAYGAPLIPHVIGVLIIANTDRLLIANLVGIGDAGIYAVGSDISMVLSLLAHSFNYAWVPWFFARLASDEPGWNTIIIKLTYAYFMLLVICALIFAAISPVLLAVLATSDYQNAAQYMPWMALGYAFNGMYLMVCNYIYYAEKTYIFAWLTLFIVTINIALSYVLILRNGPIGAAQGTMLSFTVSFFITWLIANKIHPMPWLYSRKKS